MLQLVTPRRDVYAGSACVDNMAVPTYASCSGRHDVRQGNVNILYTTLFHHHMVAQKRNKQKKIIILQSDGRSGASKKIFLNRPIQFYLKKRDRYRSSPVNFTKYNIMLYNMEIVSRPYTSTLTSLHAIYLSSPSTLVVGVNIFTPRSCTVTFNSPPTSI